MASLSLAFDILARDKASRELKKVGEAAEGAGQKGSAMGKALKVGLGAAIAGAGAAIAGITAFGADSVKSLARIERINSQTENVIRSMGGAANVTAADVERLTSQLENLTATEAENIQEGANLLLTFGNIRNEVGANNNIFDQATTAIVDMSRALGQDTSASAIQLGKALNDPLRGITALQRVGVSFTAEQKKMVEEMVAAGDVMGAQKIILAELENQFGGSGEAFAKTTEGQIELAKHAIGTLGETVTAAFLPFLGRVAGGAAKLLNDLATGFSEGTGPAGRFREIMAQVGSGMEVVGGFIRDEVWPALVDLGGVIQTRVWPAAQQLGSVIKSQVWPAMQDLWRILVSNRDVLVPLMIVLAGAVVTFKLVTGAIVLVKGAIVAWRAAQIALNAALFANPIGIVIGIIAALVAIVVVAYQRHEGFRKIVDQAWAGIQNAVRVAWEDYIKPAFTAIAGFITDTLIPTIVSLWQKHVKPTFQAIGAVIKFVWDTVIYPVFRLWWAYVTNVLVPIIRFLWENVVRPIFNLIGSLIKGVWDRLIWPILKAWWAYIQNVLIPVLRFLWENVVKPVFDRLGAKIRDTWNNTIKPNLERFRDIVNKLRENFETARTKANEFIEKLRGIKLPQWIKDLKEIIDKIGKGLGTAGNSVREFFGFGDAPGSFRGTRIGGGRSPQGYSGTALRRVMSVLPPGLRVTSTYRAPAHNRRVGGSPTSLHMDRDNPAVDIAGPVHLMDQFAGVLRSMGGWRQLLWRTRGHWDHIHVAHDGGRVSSSWPTLPGLRSDERPAILQVGETVTPRGGGGDTITIGTLVVQASDVPAEVLDWLLSIKRRARMVRG